LKPWWSDFEIKVPLLLPLILLLLTPGFQVRVTRFSNQGAAAAAIDVAAYNPRTPVLKPR
jgi:hypothetical protein